MSVPDQLIIELREELAHVYGEDIAQETVCRLLEHQASGQTIDNPIHWCRKTAASLRKHEYRDRRRLLPLAYDPDGGDLGIKAGDASPNGVPPGAWRVTPTQEAVQLTRLEALEALQLVDRRLVDEATGGEVARSKDARKRMRRQAQPHPHHPRRSRPGRCSRCGLGRRHPVHTRIRKQEVA